MPIVFYAGSGSPYAWRVWLALEAKTLPYELRMLSFSKGEHKTPAYLALNPRGKVPALVDDGAVITESSAIVAYLEEKYPDKPLLPADLVERARIRRIASEVDTCLFRHVATLSGLTLHRQGDPAPKADVDEAWKPVLAELERFAAELRGDFFDDGPTTGPTRGLTTADCALIPFLALFRRIHARFPSPSPIPPAIDAYTSRMEKRPEVQTSWPPHWR